MNVVIKKISRDFSGDLYQIFTEHDKGDILKKIWENDIQQYKKDFFKDHAKNVNTNYGSKYSVIT